MLTNHELVAQLKSMPNVEVQYDGKPIGWIGIETVGEGVGDDGALRQVIVLSASPSVAGPIVASHGAGLADIAPDSDQADPGIDYADHEPPAPERQPFRRIARE